MKRIEYSASTNITMELHRYHKVMSPLRIKEVVETVVDMTTSYRFHLRCRISGILGNYEINISSTHPVDVHEVVDAVQAALEAEVKRC